CARKNSNFDYW
nr:immunoglobulin heavy chain junction region [Macaca mulatta]MOV51286.1 immunoglobulin heavy chain junction region [Macaca mulatta]MOV51435.1 immunoglobulin heavy chain junction region [Macaca mulatta]MOV51648.1 immunoglobulin heavy chain junction region [Macaca mulatta]